MSAREVSRDGDGVCLLVRLPAWAEDGTVWYGMLVGWAGVGMTLLVICNICSCGIGSQLHVVPELVRTCFDIC